LAETDLARNAVLHDAPGARPLLASRGIPRPAARLREHVAVRGAGGEAELAWLETVAAASRTTGPPRFLLRVDEFPYSSSFDLPDRYGLEPAHRFHAVLADAGVPYLMAIVPQLTHAVLDPRARGGRALDAADVAFLEQMAAEGVTFAQHGTTHRTRYRSPRMHSEFLGLSSRRLAAVLDDGLMRLHEVGIEPRILVPPFNRFSAGQLRVFAERYDVVTGGPESVRFVGQHHSPLWLGDVVYMPCLPPLYGTARELLPAVRRLLESAPGAWVPLGLHLAWELDDDLVALAELAELLSGGAAVPWERLLERVALSRRAT
jgi:hypothetical protein